jgi:hypothetical protein
MSKFRLVNKPAKKDDGKYYLTPNEKETVKWVVRECRAEADGPMSRAMRLIADETAQEILSEEYGIVVALDRIARVA